MPIIAVCLAMALTAPPPPEVAWQDLFNGKNLDGWVVEGPTMDKTGKPMWAVENGAITVLGKGYGFLRYEKKEYTDFTYRVEYRFEAGGKGNSGLGIRTVPYDPKDATLSRPSYASFEIQLLDDAGKPANDHGSASLYRYKGPTANKVKPGPEWNTIEVTCVGPKVTIVMNGEKVLEANHAELPELKNRPKGVAEVKDKPVRGYVSLQSHGGRVEFRKVQIRELPAK